MVSFIIYNHVHKRGRVKEAASLVSGTSSALMGGPEKISLSGEPWIQCHDRITTHHQDQVTPPPPSSRFAPKTPTLRGVAVALARSNQHGRGSAVPSSPRAAAARERLRTRGAPGARVPTGARAPRQDGRAGRGGRGLIFARGRRRPIYTRRGRAHLRRSPSVAAPARRCSSSPSALLCRPDGGGRSRTAGPGPSRPVPIDTGFWLGWRTTVACLGSSTDRVVGPPPLSSPSVRLCQDLALLRR